MRHFIAYAALILTGAIALLGCSKSSDDSEEPTPVPITNLQQTSNRISLYPSKEVVSESGYRIRVVVGKPAPNLVESSSLSLSGGSNDQ